MLVFSEKKMRSGSCELTMVSMWNLWARYLRSSWLPGAVGTTAGITSASVPVFTLSIFSASTAKAPPEECKRAAAWWG